MSHRKYLTAAAAAAAVIGLSACGTSAGDTHSASTGQKQQQSTPDETRDAPPTPLPETDDANDMFDEAYLDALDEEGIDLDDDTALDAADLVCELDGQGVGFVTVTNRVATETGLDDHDVGYVYGAAIVTCGIGGGDA